MTRKIVLNDDYGGFALSREAFQRLRELGCQAAIAEPDYGEPEGFGVRKPGLYEAFCRDIDRRDPLLIQVVEEMGPRASGPLASLRIVELGETKKKWRIISDDGWERIEYRDHGKPWPSEERKEES